MSSAKQPAVKAQDDEIERGVKKALQNIASAVGLEVRSSTRSDTLTAFAISGTGLILGAGLALLLAPKAGNELRHDIAEKMGEIARHPHAQAPQPAPAGNPPGA